MLNERNEKNLPIASAHNNLIAIDSVKVMIDAAPIIIAIYDSDYRTIDCNAITPTLFGYKNKTEFIEEYNRNPMGFSASCQPCGTPSEVKARQLLEKAVSEGRAQYEWVNRTKDGRELLLDVTLVRVDLPDSYVLVSYSQDLSQIKEAEKQRVAAELPKKIVKDPFTLDLLSNQALLNDHVLDLTNTEFKLLYLCIQNEGKLMDFGYIYENIWGRSMGDNKNAVQAAVKRFRQKIEPAGYDIYAVRGKGYIFEEA